jgi:hypothetical protein
MMNLIWKLLMLAAIQIDDNGVVTGNDYAQGAPTGLLLQAATWLIYITGAVSVIVVIIGGLRYTLSGGNPKAIEDAKNTILGAVIGLIIAGVAYSIVRFILHWI